MQPAKIERTKQDKFWSEAKLRAKFEREILTEVHEELLDELRIELQDEVRTDLERLISRT